MGDLPLRTPNDRRLGGPLPRLLSNHKHAHPIPLRFIIKGCPLMTHGELIRLSAGYAPVWDRLHTCYAPVRRSPPIYCYIVLPLDLHVLGLSLAFILSQDQTLRCKNYLFPSSERLIECTGIFQGTFFSRTLVQLP